MFKKSLSVMMFLCLAFVFSAVSSAGPPPFTSTTLVGCTGAPVTDGANLLAANLAATPPALIKLEPCFYNLSGAQLVMRDFVDIEGSGRDVTTIFSDTSAALTNATVRVAPGINTELRQLTVQHSSNGPGTGVSADSDEFLLTEVNVEVKNQDLAVGVETNGSSPRLNEVFIRLVGKETIGARINGGGTVVTDSLVVAISSGTSNVGWKIDRDAAPIFDQVIAIVSSAERNVAVEVREESRPELNNVRGTAIGTEAIGLDIRDRGFAEVKESTFKALSDNFSVAALIENRGAAKATESTFVAAPIAVDHVNVFAVRLTGRGSIDSNQSNYDGSSFAAQNLGVGQGRFGASQLIGSVFSSSITGLQCIFAYNGGYTARNAQCI